MADLLAQIVARKREEVAARLGGRRVDADPTDHSLSDAIARPGTRFIMEVKRRSPSGHRATASVEQALAAYAGVADAISVLTDGPGFGGSLDDLRLARRRFDGPILAKDFIVDAAQGWGKSAIPAPGPSREFPPDRPPTESYEIFPRFHIAPFHFDHPVTGRPPQYPPGTSTTARAS